MKDVKKYIAFALSLTIVFGLLTGCNTGIKKSKDSSLLSKEDPVIVEIWTYYKSLQMDTLNLFIKKFNETRGLELGIIVKQSSFGEIDALTDALLLANKSDGGSSKMPDMFISFKGVASQLQNVEFVDFREFLTDEEVDGYVDAFVTTGATVHSNGTGTINMFPIGKASEVLLINENEFDRLVSLGVLSYEELGDYESLAEMAKRYYEYTDSLTAESGDGKALFGVDSFANVFFLSAAELGHDIVSMQDNAEKIDFDRREVFEKIYKYIYVPYVKGYYDVKSRYVTEDIRSGELLLGQCATSAVPFFPEEVVGENGELTPISGKVMQTPHFRGSNEYFLIQGGGVFGIKHSEKSLLASAEFLKWLTSEENAIEFSMSISYMPPLEASFSGEVVQKAMDDGIIDELLADTYLLMFEKINKNRPYEPMATDNYELVRKVIGDYMFKSIEEGRELYAGVGGFDDEKYFEEWYSGLRVAVYNALTEAPVQNEYNGD